MSFSLLGEIERLITTKYAKGAKMEEERIVFKEESYKIKCACLEVYKEKGRFVNQPFSRI